MTLGCSGAVESDRIRAGHGVTTPGAGRSDTLDSEKRRPGRVQRSGERGAEEPRRHRGDDPLVKVAKDVAVKARTSAMISLKVVSVNAPGELPEELQPPLRGQSFVLMAQRGRRA
jgi:hypothetical protein